MSDVILKSFTCDLIIRRKRIVFIYFVILEFPHHEKSQFQREIKDEKGGGKEKEKKQRAQGGKGGTLPWQSSAKGLSCVGFWSEGFYILPSTRLAVGRLDVRAARPAFDSEQKYSNVFQLFLFLGHLSNKNHKTEGKNAHQISLNNIRHTISPLIFFTISSYFTYTEILQHDEYELNSECSLP